MSRASPGLFRCLFTHSAFQHFNVTPHPTLHPTPRPQTMEGGRADALPQERSLFEANRSLY